MLTADDEKRIRIVVAEAMATALQNSNCTCNLSPGAQSEVAHFMGMIKDTGGDSYSAGNIRHGEKWLGLATEQPDPAFCRFVSPEYGTRAMGRILSNYQRRHGLKTLRGIVSRWAPPAENDTDAYIRHVCDQVGAGPDDAIDMENPETLEALTAAIITHEKWDQSIQPRTDPPLHRLGPGGIGGRYGTDFGGPEEMIF